MNKKSNNFRKYKKIRVFSICEKSINSKFLEIKKKKTRKLK